MTTKKICTLRNLRQKEVKSNFYFAGFMACMLFTLYLYLYLYYLYYLYHYLYYLYFYYFYYSLLLFFTALAGIMFERKSRRTELAMYTLNRSLENVSTYLPLYTYFYHLCMLVSFSARFSIFYFYFLYRLQVVLKKPIYTEY